MATNIEKYGGYLNTFTTYNTACGFCGKEFICEFDDSFPVEPRFQLSTAIYNLLKDRWQEVSSEKFGCIDLACKECANTPDKDRG